MYTQASATPAAQSAAAPTEARPARAGRQRGQAHRRGVDRAQPHLAPGEALVEQRRQAHDQRRRDLDGLQDDAVGDRFGGRDVVGARQHGHARGLEDTHVGGRRGDHGRDVDGEEHRRGRVRRRPASRGRAPSAEASRRATEASRRRAGSTRRKGGRARAGGTPRGPRAGAAATRRPAISSACRRRKRETAEGGIRIGASSTASRRRSGARASSIRSRVVAVEDADPRERDRRPGSPSASRLRIVWETIVPSTTGSVSRARPEAAGEDQGT